MRIFRKQIAGFPAKQMLVVALMRFLEPLAFTSMFPYLYFMIRDFHVGTSEGEIWKYSGFLALLFALSQFLFVLRWGRWLDVVGRKPVLLCGLLGTLVLLLVFGFSTNFYMALAARFMAGALNGNIVVLRTVIGELCVERRHQAMGFSTLPLLFNVGSAIGPLIGGLRLLTRPNRDNPYLPKPPSLLPLKAASSAYDRFCESHPYVMANVVVAGFLWFSCIVGFLFLEETCERFRHRRDYGLELGDRLISLVLRKPRPRRPWQNHSDALEQLTAPFEPPKVPTETTSLCRIPSAPQTLLPTSDNDSIESFTGLPVNFRSAIEDMLLREHLQGHDAIYDDSDSESDLVYVPGTPRARLPSLSRRMSQAIVHTYSASSNVDVMGVVPAGQRPLPLLRTMKSMIVANCIVSLHSIAYNEFFPVFLATRFRRDTLEFPFRVLGGVGLPSAFIGNLSSSTGLVGMVMVLVVFPWIDRWLGTLRGFRLSLMFFPVVYLCVPWVVFTLQEYNPALPAWLMPVCLYALNAIKTWALAMGMPQVMLLSHRATPKENRAHVNSVTLSLLALARFIGPVTFGLLMTLGDHHGVAWASWWTMALLATVGLVQAFFMEDQGY